MKKNSKKKIFTIGLLVILVFVFSMHLPVAFAQATNGTSTGSLPANTSLQTPSYTSCWTSPATCAVYYMSYYITSILGLFVSLAAFLVQYILQVNAHVYDSPTVTIGFSVALAVANLGFVLGIIIIALATILRSETYGMKQLLWKLVVMAILVNFGLVITRPIVTFSDSLTSYFLTASTPSTFSGPSNEGFVLAIVNSGEPQNLSGGSAIPTTPTTSSADAFMHQLLSMMFGIVFTAAMVVILIALAVLLLVRYVYLGILLILLPLAWLTWIFPKFNNHFDEWWNNFIKWTFFPAMVVFFIYLAMQTVNNVSYIQSAATIASNGASDQASAVSALAGTGPGSLSGGAVTIPILQTALDEVLLVALMIGGFVAAGSLTGKAGAVVTGAAKSATKATTGYIGKKTKSGAKYGAGLATNRLRTAGRQYNSNTRETTTALQRFGSKLQGIPGLRAAGSTITNISAPKAVQEEKKGDIKKHIDENLANLTNDGLKQRAISRTAFVDPVKAAAIAQELARRDMTNDKDISPLMDRYVEVAEKMGTSEAVFNNRPDLMPTRMLAATATSPARMETREEATARAITSSKGEVVNVNAEVFNLANPAAAATKLGGHVSPGMIQSAVLALSPAQLGALGSDTTAGSQARQNNLTEAIKTLVAPYKKLNATTGKNELDVSALPANLKNLEKIVKHMESSPNWGSVLN